MNLLLLHSQDKLVVFLLELYDLFVTVRLPGLSALLCHSAYWLLLSQTFLTGDDSDSIFPKASSSIKYCSVHGKRISPSFSACLIISLLLLLGFATYTLLNDAFMFETDCPF